MPMLPRLRVLTFPTIRRRHPWAFTAPVKVAVALAVQGIVLIPYLAIRAGAEDIGFPRAHGVIISIERAIGGGQTPNERLQALYTGFGPLEWALFAAYASFFFIPMIVVAAVAATDWNAIPRLVLAYVLLYYTAALSFVLLPTEPPWMALGVDRLLYQSGFDPGTDIDPNQLAAFPSLHVATPALFAFFGQTRGYWWWRVMALDALLIGIAIVYFGEHYVVDAVAGVALSWGVVATTNSTVAGALAESFAAPRARVRLVPSARRVHSVSGRPHVTDAEHGSLA